MKGGALQVETGMFRLQVAINDKGAEIYLPNWKKFFPDCEGKLRPEVERPA